MFGTNCTIGTDHSAADAALNRVDATQGDLSDTGLHGEHRRDDAGKVGIALAGVDDQTKLRNRGTQGDREVPVRIGDRRRAGRLARRIDRPDLSPFHEDVLTILVEGHHRRRGPYR